MCTPPLFLKSVPILQYGIVFCKKRCRAAVERITDMHRS